MPNDTHNKPAASAWAINKQIDILKVLAILVALIGAYFTLKNDADNLKQQLARAEARIGVLERREEGAGHELSRLAVLEAQQKMSEKSLSEIKETLKAIDGKVDDMRKEIRGS